jgi:YD repeat-containing protein
VGADGSLYVAEQNNYRVRRVRPDGVIITVAGNGQFPFSGDGGPATQAGMEPYGVAAGPEGSLYIADRANSRIRMVDQNGNVSTVAGSSISGFSGDGGPADQARISSPNGVTMGPDGSLFIVDRGNSRIRRVSPQGLISTVAGSGQYGFSGDGGAAESAKIAAPYRVGVGRDGSLYIPDFGNERVRWVGSEGIIGTVAGTGVSGIGGDGGLAPQAKLSGPAAVAVGPDGAVYVADSYNHRIRRVVSALPGSSASDILLPSTDGGELYVFSGAGRHLRTLDALTGALRAQFSYDDAGRLLSVDDGDGNVTTVERDPATGQPTAIVAPFGQRTELALDANGFLSGITNPANEAVSLASTATGLLTTLTDPRGGIYRFFYDAQGRLTRDEDPAGGVKTLAPTDTPTGSSVAVSTGLGRTTTYQTERLVSGAQRHVITEPGGASTERVTGTNGSRNTTYPDGTVEVVVPGPDPRWGMQAPVLASFTSTTPGGLVETITGSRTATLASATDPFSLQTQTDTLVVNGRTWTTVYQAASKTLTSTSPAGRQATSTLDTRGRVVQHQVAGLLLESFAYDGRGRLISAVQGTAPSARTTTLAYDSEGFLETLTDPLGQVTSFAYDAVGRITFQTLPGARTVGFAYDAAGNVSSLTPPGRSAHAFGYTPVDLDASYTPPTLPGTPTTQTASSRASPARTPPLSTWATTWPGGSAASRCRAGCLASATMPPAVWPVSPLQAGWAWPTPTTATCSPAPRSAG